MLRLHAAVNRSQYSSCADITHVHALGAPGRLLCCVAMDALRSSPASVYNQLRRTCTHATSIHTVDAQYTAHITLHCTRSTYIRHRYSDTIQKKCDNTAAPPPSPPLSKHITSHPKHSSLVSASQVCRAVNRT